MFYTFFIFPNEETPRYAAFHSKSIKAIIIRAEK